MRIKILLFLLFPFFCSCERTGLTITDVVKVEISDEDEMEGIAADSLFSSVDYVVLELTDNSLIGEIHKIDIDDSNDIYVFDRRSGVIFIFSPTGDFKYKLDKRGAGPGEYVNLTDFSLKDQLIYCLCTGRNCIQIYNISPEMNHVESIPLDGAYDEMILSNDYLFLYNSFSSSGYLITAYDLNKREIISKMKGFPDSQLGVGYLSRMFYEFNNVLYSTFNYEYSINKIKMEEVEEVVKYDFGDKNIFPDYLQKASSDDRKDYCRKLHPFNWPISEISHPVVTNNYFISTFVARVSNYTLFHDKQTNETFHGYIYNTKDFPLVTPYFHHYVKDRLIQSIEMSSLMYAKERKEVKEKIPESLKSLDEDSNPVLGFYTLKEKYQ